MVTLQTWVGSQIGSLELKAGTASCVGDTVNIKLTMHQGLVAELTNRACIQYSNIVIIL